MPAYGNSRRNAYPQTYGRMAEMVAPVTGEFTLTGQAMQTRRSLRLVAEQVEFSTSGQTVATRVHLRLAAATGDFAIYGNDIAGPAQLPARRRVAIVVEQEPRTIRPAARVAGIIVGYEPHVREMMHRQAVLV